MGTRRKRPARRRRLLNGKLQKSAGNADICSFPLNDQFYGNAMIDLRKPGVFNQADSVLLDFRFVETTCHLDPVNYIPERRDVIGSAILIVQVVGVFPYIQTQNRCTS